MNAHLLSRSSKVLLGILFALCLAPLIVTARPLENATTQIEPLVLEQFAAQNEITYWVILREKADLRPAFAMQNWEARGRFVYERLKAVALHSQAAIRAQLHGKGVAHQPFWIVNAIKVTSNKATLQELAARPEVEQIVPDGGYQIPEPLPGQPQPSINAVEWNIDRINAPQVWSTFSDRGEGIIIANIDTGVQFDHPALVAQYRGNQGGGNFDHNYNWFDPSQICGSPSLVPCDNVGHGSHTMGTMVGDDGGSNQIGVAPGARWIAAKGCETNSCSDSALLAAGQWVLAPTDLNGNNPRPDLRPHIVNNSWGDGPGNLFFEATVNAWIASGIFPAFSNGNAGPGCNSSGSPGDYGQSYSAGAFDINNSIAGFSSRGPSFSGEIKPNIAAPGVDVRSSVPGNGYAWGSGTSMASPHVAGTVALMWSAAPSIIGDIATTRALLDQTAIDTSDLICGGSDGDNNVWGEGRLDAFAAVERAPRGPTGALQGTVVTTDPFLSPLPGAAVQVAGPTNRMTLTDAAGQYAFSFLPVGTYDMLVSLFGYLTGTATGVTVSEGAITVQDFTLVPAPSHIVSGYVRDNNGNPVANATVAILETPISPTTTDGTGFYSFAKVPEGEYDVLAAVGGCNDSQTLHLVVDGDVALDFTLPQRTDAFGYFCQHTTFDYIEAANPLPLSGDDTAVQVDLPFPFTFYGQTYNTAFVSTNGFLNFLELNAYLGGSPIPNPSPPNAAIYPFWDDLYVSYDSGVNTELLGQAPDRRFVIEWRNVHFCCVSAETFDFEVVLYENGRILMQYRNIDPNGREQGNSATVGIENESGTVGLQYSYDEPVLSSNLAVLYRLPPSGFIEGHVTDAFDELPVVATVKALQDGSLIRATKTYTNGFYRMQVPVGTYTVNAAAKNYSTESAQVVVGEDQFVTQNFALRSGRAQIAPAALEFLAVEGKTRSQVLTLRNTGQADLTFTIGEFPVAAVASSQVTLPPGVDSQTAAPDYTPTSAYTVLMGGPTLVFMDAYPWGSNALLQVLNANDIPYDTATSAQMSTIDLSQYDVVFISSDQPQGFYNNYAANFTRFEDYVYDGGFLWVGAAAWGWNGGDFTGGQLPGGATVRGPVFESYNDVIDNAHPIMQGVPDPFYGSSASHTAFENLPTGTNVIARGQSSNLPTLIEYTFGAGRVLAFGQTLEFGFQNGQDPGRILENGVPYAYAFVPAIDITWLSENPTSGTVAPGATQAIQVTVDTTGLAPGLYRARLIFRTNDPRNPRLQVPVTLIVPAYQQGVNAGGKAYTDRAGDTWAADKQYASGSWGYVNRSTTLSTKKAIAGTDEDKLYQDLRSGVLEYRFDGLPAGVYQVELDFAELKPTQPGLHMFDVLIEGNMALYKHDIALEVGSFAADNHTFFVPLTDGQLNVRFIPYRGYGDTIVSALRVTHRPDR